MNMPIRLTIEGAGFRKLVRGEELVVNGVHIILEDFGFNIMREYVNEAERDQNEKSTSSDPTVSG